MPLRCRFAVTICVTALAVSPSSAPPEKIWDASTEKRVYREA
jgi:hypothetical protein